MTLFDQEVNGWAIPDGYTAEPQEPPAHCRTEACNAEILWAQTPKGNRMPLNRDGTSHFATCVGAANWRKRGKK